MRSILFFFFSIIALEGYGQSSIYHPFPDSNAVWNWHFNNYYCTPWSPIDEEYSYSIDGDTIIGSVQYHKILTPFVQINNTGCGTFNNVGYVGSIRQDIINRKVYCILPGDTVEHLIFDFTLQVGDSVPTIPYSCDSKIFISQVDSVLIGTTYRKRWSDGGWNIIIEGIGANWEFLKPMCNIIDGASGMLTCFRQDGASVYPDSLFNCSFITNIKSISNNQSAMNLFPNPFNSSMTVSINVEKASMLIYNSIGEFVREVKINYYSTVISRNGLIGGIYFYRLLYNNGEISAGKFAID